jgi:AAA+ ATPase superfamily predicted ATPase
MAFTIQPAQGLEFVNRQQELNDILSTLKDLNSSLGFALYGKRRVGKTSLLKEIKRLLEKEGSIVPIYFCVWDLVEKNIREFAKELGAAIIDAYKPHLPLEYRAKELVQLPLNFLKKIIAGLKLSVELQDSISFILSFDKEKGLEPGTLINEVFTLPEKLAQVTKRKSVLFLDEFPDIIELKVNGKKIGEGIIKKIRTIQEDYRKTSFNISGSIKKTMEIAILSASSAFYRQFIVKEIGPLARRDVRQLMDKNLDRKNLSKEGLRKLYDFTKGIPFYVQFIGRLLNRYPVKSISAEEVNRVIEEFLEQEGNLLFKEELERLGDKERLIVITMATKGILSFSQISKVIGGQVTNLGRFLVYLEEKDILQKEKRGSYIFTDPIFESWLKRKF